MNRRTFLQSSLAGVASAALPDSLRAAEINADLDQSNRPARRTGRVRLDDHSLVDDQGAFLGLGVSYFTALWRYRHDRARLESDLALTALASLRLRAFDLVTVQELGVTELVAGKRTTLTSNSPAVILIN